jgi:drug/metabolite transporter (DMT)-like permease
MHLASEGVFWSIIFGVPWWFCKRVGKLENPFVASRFLRSVLLVWAVLVPFYFLVGQPIAIARAHERGNLMYDGDLESAIILVGGWTLGIFGTVTSFLAYRLVQSVKARKRELKEKS